MDLPVAPEFDVVELLGRDRERLLTLLDGLDESAWGRSTPCPGWNVADLAAHILGSDLGVVSRDGFGHGVRPPRPPESMAELAAFVDGLNDEWVRACRAYSPRLTIELLRWTGPRLLDLYRATAAESTANVSWIGDEPVPKWVDHARELTERWTHRQQIRIALWLPTDEDPELLAAVLDTLRLAFPRGIRHVERPNGARVRLRFGPPVDRSYDLVRSDGRWRFASPDGPCDQIELDAEVAWRSLTGNAPSDQPAGPVRSSAAGDDLLAAVLATRAVIGPAGAPGSEPTPG